MEETDRQDLSHGQSVPFKTQPVSLWVCLSESTLILPFVCVMNQLNEGGCASKSGTIFPILRHLKTTPIVLCFSASFCPVGVGGWGSEGVLFLSDLEGNKCGRGTLRGRCSGCARPCLISNTPGPDWTVPGPSGETPPPWEQLLTKRRELFWKSEHSPHGREECLQNSQHKALIHKFQALLIPALPV